MKVVVTGGAGFIGHHVVRAFVERNAEVVVLDDLSAGRRENLADLEDRIRLVVGDVRDPEILRAVLGGVDAVAHLAAIPSVARSVDDPALVDDVNVGGTIQVMLAAAARAVRRVVLAGSCSVYGTTEALPHREAQLPEPRSPYATGKLAAEHYLHNLGEIGRVETVALRYFNVYGPGQDPASDYAAVVPRFVTAALAGRRPIVYGDGTQTRDFTHVDDVAAATVLAAIRPDVSGLTANIGCGGRHSLLDLLGAVSAAVGRPQDPEFRPARPGDVRHSQAAIELAETRLGFRPAVPFASGIARTVAWYGDRVGVAHAS